MAVTYTQTLSTEMIVSDLEVMTDWRANVIRQAFYPDAKTQNVSSEFQSQLLDWCRRESGRNALDQTLCERLAQTHAELCHAAKEFLDAGSPPPVAKYDAFENQTESYVTLIRRLHQDLADTAGAVDMLTGLRTVAGLRNELRREQDRYDRKGTSFSIASLEIDRVDDLKSKHDRRAMDAIYAGFARHIAQTVRSFDDAYYLGSGEYLIVLKHVEFMDACAVMDRLRKEIEASNMALPNGEQVPVTASLGIAEAQQRSQVDHVLEHAKSARVKAREAGGNRVVEYHERSALEHYARDQRGA